MDARPIGVFDSGLGGLTAVKELSRILPEENIVYFGDTGRVPYGSRSREILRKYTRQDINFLLSQNVKMILAACGTVSSTAPDILQSVGVPATGVIFPTAQAAASATRNGKIGIIGTTATIRSGSYRRELEKIDPALSVYEKDCPLFVPLVESGFVDDNDEITLLTAQRYLSSLRESGVDTLIMGCTHYPIISRIISKVMGGGVTLIDSGRETALWAARALRESGLLAEGGGERSFFVSDYVENFSQIAEIFLGCNILSDVQRIDIEKY